MKALSRIRSVVRIAATSYLGIVLYLAGCQRSLLYYPARDSSDKLRAQAARIGMEPWHNHQGEIIGWKTSGDATADAWLVMHGNGGYALHREYILPALQQAYRGQPVSIYLLEYPGYGARKGKPSEKSLTAAANEALALLTSTNRRIFVVGESLGSGVASRLAGDHPDQVAGVLLITPFASLVEVASFHYPLMPVSWLLRDRFASAEALTRYHGPVFILLAEFDEVVPARFGQKLYDHYHGPKRVFQQDGRNHNTLDHRPGHPWWSAAVEFLSGQNSK